jgi:ferredoxin
MKKIVVDYSLCEANGRCVKIAPELFQLDDEDSLHLLAEHPPQDLLDRAEKAVRLCPRAALSLVDEA